MDVHFEYRMTDRLPSLAWLARLRPDRRGAAVEVVCGASVRCTDDGFFEGTWAGRPDLAALAGATTVFGTGIVGLPDGPLVVTPSHQLESVYLARADGGLAVSNSLVGLLEAAGLQLDPAADYPAVFLRSTRGAAALPITIPTLTEPVTMCYFENVRLDDGLAIELEPKPREAPFATFEDYRDRLRLALASLIANADRHAPVVALSAGYDSTAIAALAAPLGCRKSVGFATAKPLAKGVGVDDSGAATARSLGMEFSLHDRLAYLARGDMPEAEFLASGMSGEDVVFSSFEEELRGSMLLTGNWPAGIWSAAAPAQLSLERDNVAGASMTEFRLRNDTICVHPAYFGATEQQSLVAISASPEMARYRVGGSYDRPIPRRIAEEAGLARGSFATHKLAVSHNLNRHGRAAFSAASLHSIDAFAANEGRPAELRWTPRVGRLHRASARVARRLGAGWLVAALERRRLARMHFEPATGGLLLRWSVSRLRERYRTLD